MKRFSENKGCRTEIIYDRDTQAFGYRAEPIPVPGTTQVPAPAEPGAAAPAPPADQPPADSGVKAALRIRSRRLSRFTLASRRL